MFASYSYFIEVKTNTDFISAFPPKCTVDNIDFIPNCPKKLSIYPNVYVTLNYEKNDKIQGKSVYYIKIQVSAIFISQYKLFFYNV